MPVHNALPQLDQAVDSIVRQTFGDFEFVILDDASTDGSAERLRHWAAKDEQIRLIKAEENLGPVLSSQRVAGEATGPVVARMLPMTSRTPSDCNGRSTSRRLSQGMRILGRSGPRCADGGAVAKVMVIPQALYQLRQWTRNTRARSPQDRPEQAMDLAYRAVARLEQNRRYEDLLAHGPNDDRLDPRVFVSLGSMTL